MHWQTARFRIALDRPQVMGIVNVTPDSFSDGGSHGSEGAALAHCERLLSQGADILDIGGESTRPGSSMPTVEEELRRVVPVVRQAVRLGVPVSVDTSRTEVIDAVLDLGADIINDIRALRWPGALERVAAHGSAGVCLMHMQGEPQTMQQAPSYGQVTTEVRAFLEERLRATRDAGIVDARVTLDPGYGFGKSLEHNLQLWQSQRELLDLGRPLLVGWSRKGTLGQLTGRPLEERLVPSVAAALASIAQGARIVRVHDVAATVDAIKVWCAAGLGAAPSA